jgi:hypothetical protein
MLRLNLKAAVGSLLSALRVSGQRNSRILLLPRATGLEK